MSQTPAQVPVTGDTDTPASNHSTTTSGYRQEVVVRGRWGIVVYALWWCALIGSAAYAVLHWVYFYEYLHSGIAPVAVRWSADRQRLTFITSEGPASSQIATGDVLVLRDGQPWPYRSALAYKEERILIYGPLGSTTTLTVQTGDAPPREVIFTLDKITDPTLRWYAGLGLPLEPLRIAWAIFEALFMFGTTTAIIALMWKQRRLWVVQLMVLALFYLCLRSMADVLRFLPEYGMHIQPVQPIASFLLLWVGLIIPNGRWQQGWFPLVLLLTFAVHGIIRYLGLPFYTLSITGTIILETVILAAMLWLAQRRYQNLLTPIERQQVKWLLVSFVIGIVTITSSILVSQILRWEDNGMALVAGALGRATSMVAIINVVISLQRFRLYDADYVLNRSLVYTAVTTILVVVFIALLAIVNLLVQGTSFAVVGLVVAGLCVGALFNPLRLRLQRLIDRRFFRLRLDLNQLAQQQQSQVKGALSNQVVGAYQLGNLIGRGGMGEVYHAKRGEQAVAFKALLPERQGDAEVTQRFAREIYLMQQFSHPNLVHLIDHGRADGIAYLVIEWVQGHELGAYLKQQPQQRLPLDQTLLILRDVAEGLDYLHKLNIVHRDIKPSNVLIQDTRAVLVDFGIARQTDHSTAITKEGMLGSLDYCAPEQIADAQKVTQSADVYSLGVMAYQMLTGELPFKGFVGQVVFAHLQQPPPDACDLLPTLPPAVGAAICRAMGKAPADRYPSAGVFVRALQAAARADTDTAKPRITTEEAFA
jgi:hypothetical protein